MKCFRASYLLIVLVYTILCGCANIVPPSGGERDTTPPVLLSVSPKDSLLNTRVTKLEMKFDEYVEIHDVAKEIQVSPLLEQPVTAVLAGKKVIVNIADSLLSDSTTYRISFGNAIKDLHEGNVFTGYHYMFSTGSYFDSLKLQGYVYDAATGMPDSGLYVVLYPATKSDSAVVREKPMYITNVGAGGAFTFAGLPPRRFHIYAMRDVNGNLVYDGGEEAIGFIDSVIRPTDSITQLIFLHTFKEPIIETLTDSIIVPDSVVVNGDSSLKDSSLLKNAVVKKPLGKASRLGGKKRQPDPKEGLQYNVQVDTSTVDKRTFDITKPLDIVFNKKADTINSSRIRLSFDSLGVDVETDFTITPDTAAEELQRLNSNWKENTLYTLRLLKGFAKDTSGADVMPSRYTFRTKSDEDYSKLGVHVPGKYYGREYILMVTLGSDTIYNKPVLDSMVRLNKLQPGSYNLRVIHDKNKNGKWDPGDLLAKRQPETVIPYMIPVELRAGWENTVDFEKEERKFPELRNPMSREKKGKLPEKK